MRRKHRVLVEVTFDKRVTAKHAKNVVERALGYCDWNITGSASVINHDVKEAERVIQAELRWRGKKSAEGSAAD